MKLADELRYRRLSADADHQEYIFGLSPIAIEHPPSLKNPIRTKIPTSQDGWKKGDSKEARKQAMLDLVEIHKRLRRQFGKPEIARTADYPLFPALNQIL